MRFIAIRYLKDTDTFKASNDLCSRTEERDYGLSPRRQAERLAERFAFECLSGSSINTFEVAGFGDSPTDLADWIAAAVRVPTRSKRYNDALKASFNYPARLYHKPGVLPAPWQVRHRNPLG